MEEGLQLEGPQLLEVQERLVDFRAADSHPVEQQIDVLRPKAYAVLSNTGSLEDFHAAINGVLELIRSGEQK